MNFSKLRHRIIFLKPTGTYKNTMGENVPEYTEYKTVWAEVSPKTGRAYDESQKLRAETTYNIRTRYHDGITSDMQIKYVDRVMKIESVLNLSERNEELLMVASEVNSFI